MCVFHEKQIQKERALPNYLFSAYILIYLLKLTKLFCFSLNKPESRWKGLIYTDLHHASKAILEILLLLLGTDNPRLSANQR